MLLLYTLIFFRLLLPSHGGRPQLIGSSQPIVATVGDDIILPCHLEPATDASDMRLEWARPDLSPGFIHVMAAGREHVDDKQPSYRGRTSIFVDKLKHGDVSLNLSEVKVSDEGTYRCLAPSLGRATFIKLVVVAASSPDITVMNRASLRVVLQCESEGWYPEPEVLWLDGEGILLSAGPPETVRGPDELYTVSSRVTVEKTHSSRFTCRLQQKNTNQTREAHIHLPVLSRYVKLLLAPGLLSVLVCFGFIVHGWPKSREADCRHLTEVKTQETDEQETAGAENPSSSNMTRTSGQE
ncbi:butyrophilin subfamily 1 member A1-like [Sebastes umbrosus]|uniref:butyrophilin subfamily 1 member A1-like n=1 Tax=Sebastes umbrosus TaxID=72105 RepID=UPI00189F6FDD|nr:butyrophilin subfamily 1 member A1-like [Sebastes umbrosus]